MTVYARRTSVGKLATHPVVTSMDFQASVLRTDAAPTVLRDAATTERTYVFSTRHGGMRCMNGHIEAWTQELFQCGRTQNSTVIFDLDNPPNCGQNEWWRFTGWLPQMRIRLIFIAAPGKTLPVWASVLMCEE
jgi:hypothetical protein